MSYLGGSRHGLLLQPGHKDDEKGMSMEEVQTIELTKGTEQGGVDFLAERGLMDRIAEDITTLGYVGEDRNKLLLYLVATSRKMEDPIACVVKGDSSAGKSCLVETIIKLVPSEDREVLSRATKQVFFYEGDLSHKLIYIKEVSGSEDASYAIRSLLSEKVLKLKRVVGTVIQEFVVLGPISYVETTAEDSVEAQKANRVFEIWVDESQDHTLEIHRMQREQCTLRGLEARQQSSDIIRRHHIAQHLLEPLPVVIPYATAIDFPSRLVRNRRDHQRFLDLIRVIAFLHQYQRRHDQLSGQEYIEAALEDYEMAYQLMLPVLTNVLDEYGAKPRELLDGISKMAQEKAQGESVSKVIFTRTEIAEFLGWTKRQVRTHIKELEDLEALEVVRGGRGQEYKYRLLRNNARGLGISKLLEPGELGKKL